MKMKIVVINCLNWVAYHIIDELLLADYTVTGVPEADEDEKLLHFFGRNDNFSLVETGDTKGFQQAIVVGDYNDHEIEADEWYFINPDKRITNFDSKYVIQTNMLIGEWMKIDDETISKEKIQLEAIYIKDFVKLLIKLMNTEVKAKEINVESVRNRKNKDVSLENYVYLHENRPIDEQWLQVKKHYNKTKHMI